ncbi:MAG: hypothetical protein ACOZIN_06750 [Myxococcota bacterium]
MKKDATKTRRSELSGGPFLLLVFLSIPSTGQAGNFPFEIVHPHTGDTAVVRHTKAYPGLEYYLEPVAIGGDWPWTAALTNAPAGMTVASEIDPLTGMPKIVIRWPNPTTAGSPHNVTLQMWDSDTDGAGPNDIRETDTVSWTVTVTTDGFLFLDAVNGNDSNPGTPASPKRTINGFFLGSNGDSTYADYFVYFRAGTYTWVGVPASGSGLPRPGQQITIGTNKPTVWLAYPGDAMPVVDYGYNEGAGSAPVFVQMDDPYIDGLHFTNSINHFFRGFSPYARVLRSKFSNLGPGADGFNSSGIMSVNTGCTPAVYPNITGCHEYGAITTSEFTDFENASAIKIYSLKYFAFQLNKVHNFFGTEVEGIALKGGVMYHMDVTGNHVYGVVDRAMNGNWQDIHKGDFRFNRFHDNGGPRSWFVNQGGSATEIWMYRNTILGRVQVANVDEVTDGPFTFSNNVFVNEFSGTPAGSHIEHNNVTQPGRVIISASPNGNLACFGADACTDADGNLVGTYTQYLGQKGFEVGPSSPGSPAPAPPRNLRVQ